MRLIEDLINKYFYVDIQGADKIRALIRCNPTTKPQTKGLISTTELRWHFSGIISIKGFPQLVFVVMLLIIFS